MRSLLLIIYNNSKMGYCSVSESPFQLYSEKSCLWTWKLNFGFETNNFIHNTSLGSFSPWQYRRLIICFSCSGLAGLVSSVTSDYDQCLETGQVVSGGKHFKHRKKGEWIFADVFCLPSSYRKDVPPESSIKSLKPFSLTVKLQPGDRSMCSSSFPSRR